MEDSANRSWLLGLAAAVVVVAGLRAAAGLLEPFLIAIFIAIVCTPMVAWLRDRGLPEGLAVGLVMLGLVVVMLSAVAGLGASINGFVRALPQYQEILAERVSELLVRFPFLSVDIGPSTLREHLDPGLLMSLAGKAASQFGAVLGSFLLVLIAVAFILLEAARFPAKLRVAMSDNGSSAEVFRRFAEGVHRYLAIKSMVSLGTGVLVAIWMWVLNVDYPILWGTLAFLFNYIPNIGSFLAAVPACLLAFVLHGTGVALVGVAGFVVINTAIGNFLEPRLMGRSLGLSTLVVFMSLVFWGWVLGPVGMVLSVPLTMILRLALESREDTRWLAVLLGPEVEHESATGETGQS